MPVSSGEVFNFLKLANYCILLGQRIRTLGDEHTHLKARAGALSLVFQELHRALTKFHDTSDDYRDVFSDLRQSCYITLCNIEPVLEKLERLKSGNAVQRGARKLVIAVRNETSDLSREMHNQYDILTSMVLRLNQILDDVQRRKEHAVVVRKIDELKEELSLFRLEAASSSRPPTRTVVELNAAIQQTGLETQRILAPAAVGVDIKDAFGEFKWHHSLIGEPIFEGAANPASTSSTGAGGYERRLLPSSATVSTTQLVPVREIVKEPLGAREAIGSFLDGMDTCIYALAQLSQRARLRYL